MLGAFVTQKTIDEANAPPDLYSAAKALLNRHTMPADTSWQTRNIRDKAFRDLAAAVRDWERANKCHSTT